MDSIQSKLESAIQKRSSDNSLRTLQTSNLIDFSSNDFFGLANNPNIQKTFINNLKQLEQHGSKGSRLLSGNTLLHEQTEKLFSQYFKGENSLLFNSGYVANLGLLSAIGSRGDLFIYDELAHSSIKDGVRLSNAKHYSFRHNDLIDLEAKLKLDGNTKFVVVESLYSMDGDFAPLTNILSICNKYNANLIVDEAHATGIYGAGAGLTVELGIELDVFARVYTFGKAFASNGAIVVGSNVLKDYLINFSRTFIYSTATTLTSITHLRTILDHLIIHGEDYRNRLMANIATFKRIVKSHSNSQIQPVFNGSQEQTIILATYLQKGGFDVRPILSPTVKKGSERVRICIHSFNTETDIQQLGSLIAEIKQSN